MPKLMWVHAKNMNLYKTIEMTEDEIFRENLNLFIKNNELRNEFAKKEVENTDLLGFINDLKENQKCLKLFIKKIREDEIDACLNEIHINSELQKSKELIKKLEKHNEYLRCMINKCMNIGFKINEIINGEKTHFRNNEGDESFNLVLKNYLNMAELLFLDIKEKIKYQDKYKKLKKENYNLTRKINELGNLEISKNFVREVSLSIYEEGKDKTFTEQEDTIEIISEEKINIECDLNLNNHKVVNIESDIECLNYLVKQYKKENYELKQKLFEYEFNNTNDLNFSTEIELELEEKKQEMDELEKEYSNWVINLQEENSELRKVIKIQENEQLKFIEEIKQDYGKKIKELENIQLELIDDYEIKIKQKNEEIIKLKNESTNEKQDLENESLKENIKYLEKSVKVLSDENKSLNIEIKDKIKELDENNQKIIDNNVTIKKINEELENLKLKQNEILEKYNYEKTLHNKFQQEAYLLKKELDNVLSEIYRNNQKKTRTGIINDSESDNLTSLETLIKHCKELESKNEELTKRIELYMNGNTSYNQGSSLNKSAEIDTLFDQVQILKNEREKLKKDIRQRDWAKVEIEILHKRTTEEIDQLKKDNTRLMLENLRLRDLNNISHNSKFDLNFNNENIQSNSSRPSITMNHKNSIQDYVLNQQSLSAEIKSEATISEIDNNLVSRNKLRTILNLKAPRRPSLLFGEKIDTE